MNPDTPLTPGDENEIRLTALLLGELSDEEAEKVRAEIAADPKLAALYVRLSHAGELLREACALPEPAVPARAKLSNERRERLLAHFKSAAPGAVVVPMKRDWKWVVPLGLAAMLIAVLGGSLLMGPMSVTLYRTQEEAPDFAAIDVSLPSSEGTVAPPANPTPLFSAFAPDTPQITAPTLNTITTTNTPTPALEIAPSAPIITPVQTDAMSKALESASKTVANGASVGPPPGAMGGREGGPSGQQITAAGPAPASPSTDHFFADSPSQPAKLALKPSPRAVGGKEVDSAGIAQLDGGSIAPLSLPTATGGLTFTGAGTLSPSPSSMPTDGSTTVSAGTLILSPRPAPNGRVSKSKSDAPVDRIAGLKAPKAPLPAATPAAMAAADAAISGPFSTAGKVNLNHPLIPFPGDDRRSWAGMATDPEPMEQEISALRAPSPVAISGGVASTTPAKPSDPVSAGEAFNFSINGGAVAGAPGQPARPLVAQSNELDAPALGFSGVTAGKTTSGTELPNSSSTVVTAGKSSATSGKWGSQPGMIRVYDSDSAGQPAAEEKPMGVFGGGGGAAKGASVESRRGDLEKQAEAKKENAASTNYFKTPATPALRDGVEDPGKDSSEARSVDHKVAVKRAEQQVTEGRYQDAEITLRKALEDNPRDKDAIIMLSRLQQPDYYNKTITPGFRGKVDQVKQYAVDADGFYQSGRYDLALKRTEQILNLDPDNIPARKLQEKVNKAIDEYGIISYDETRSRAIRNLDKAWAMPIRSFDPPTGVVVEQTKSEISRTDTITRKLERIIIPKIEFKEATIREAVEFLREKSRSLDTTEPNPASRGVNMVLKLDDRQAAGEAAPEAPKIPGLDALPGAAPVTSVPAAANPEDARITVSLTNIPLSEALRYVTSLAGLKYKVEPHAISIVPASVNTEVVVTKEYKVRPELFAKLAEITAGAPDATHGGPRKGTAARQAAKDLLIENGVVFGPQAAVIYIPSSEKLIVRNTQEQLDLVEAIISAGEAEMEKAGKKVEEDVAPPQPPADALIPQAEVQTKANAFSTFSLNVTDVAFKLAAASLEQGKMPEPASMRSEEFINAFDYRDPEPAPGAPLACSTEYARYPFAQNRDLLRCSVKTAAAGRQPGRALNLVLLVDNSGSMERADRVRILNEALRVLAAQLQPQDKLSVITFARTPRLWADGVAGDQAGATCARVSEITPQGGTNIDAALDLGYATALRHYQPGSINRVVLLTDGAANLGDVHPDALKKKVEAYRQKGVALDCFGIGWEGLNDDLLEQLSRNGDGRYGFINTPEEAATEFAAQLAGALRVAASDVKVQIEFNPRRVTAYRQIGYAKHQLTKEQFRDNTVDAAEIGAAEAGNALYVVEVNPSGEGDLGTMRVRFKVPGTSDYREHEWAIPFATNAPPLEQASPALRLAGTASAFSEMLAGSPYATDVTSDRLLALLNGIPSVYGADPRPQKLEWMIRQAKSLSGR